MAHRRTKLARTVLLGAAVAAASALPIAAPAHAAKGMEVLIQDDSVLYHGADYATPQQAYPLVRGLNASRIRFNAVWRRLNNERIQRTAPKKPTYNWTFLDQAVKRARDQGLKVYLSVTGPAPRWGAARADGITRPNAKLFGAFASEVAKRYGKQVDYFSIWNEPNHKAWLSPIKTAPTQYRELYTAGYNAIKKASKKSKVLFGELAPYASKPSVATDPLTFLQKATCTDTRFRPLRGKKCPLLKADGFAHHPYDFARSPRQRYPRSTAVTIANLPALTTALDQLAAARRLTDARRKPLNLYLTEYGYFATPGASGRTKVFPASTRAKYLVDAFKVAQANRRVRWMLQFLLVQYPGAGTDDAAFNFDTAIVDSKDDGEKLVPMKTYTSLKSWATGAAKKKLIKPGPK